MNHRTNRTHSARSAGRATSAGTLSGVISISALFLVFILAFGWGAAQASGSLKSLSGPLAQATAPVEVPTVPLPAPSGVPPAAVPTGDGVPANPNSDTAPPGQNVTPSAASPSGGFPWLITIILLVVVALGVIVVLMLRSRRPMLSAAGPTVAAPAAPRVRPTPTVAPTTTTTPAATAAAAPAPSAPSTLPATLTCPNCNTENDWNENFCHNCGQDLRPVRASIIATMSPPADVVTEDMPYLETLDRTDEQLEYVLSRKRIVLGSASGCDIMIDKVFAGGSTVAPRHAQLLRNDDGSFSVTDLGAPTGTFINDTRLEANTAAAISNGDQLRIGSVRFVYRIP